MKNEELEKMTDEQLRLAFAREVAKWTTLPNQGHAGGFLARSPEGRIDWSSIGGTEDAALRWNCPDYATSADAVLPIAEQRPTDHWMHELRRSHEHEGADRTIRVVAWSGVRDGKIRYGEARGDADKMSLARGLCIALLRATRAAAEAKEGTK